MLHHVAMSAHQPPRAAVSMAKTGELRRVGRRHPASRLAYRFMERRIWIQQGQPRFSFSSVVGRESPSELEGQIRDVVLISRAFRLAPFGQTAKTSLHSPGLSPSSENSWTQDVRVVLRN